MTTMKNPPKSNLYHLFYSFLFLLLVTTNINGQGWKLDFLPDSLIQNRFPHKVLHAHDGGFIALGMVQSWSTDHSDLEISKIDPSGNIQWRKEIGGNYNLTSADITPTIDSGYVVLAHRVTSYTIDSVAIRHPYIVKTDIAGNVLWEEVLFNNSFTSLNAIKQTPDGGYLIAGGYYEQNLNSEAVLVKLDALGVSEWDRTYGTSFNFGNEAKDISINSNGTYSIVGQLDSLETLFTINPTGDILWSQNYSSELTDNLASMCSTSDGGYLLAGYKKNTSNTRDIWMVKTDANGQEQWSKTIITLNYSFATDVIPTTDGGYMIAGYGFEGGGGIVSGYAIKTDSQCNTEWIYEFKDLTNANIVSSVIQANDGGFVFAGIPDFSGNAGGFIIKLDAQGRLYTSVIEGNIAYDQNNNCLIDSLETALFNWMVEAKGDDTFYGITDASGNYTIRLDSGSYDLTIYPPNNLWLPCQSSYQFLAANDTTSIAFPVKALGQCVNLKTDVSTPFLRRCFDNVYTVSYSNQGTLPSSNNYIEVEFDTFLTVDSSSIPWTSQTGNLFTFWIGDLGIYEGGDFYVYVTLDCDSTIVGQTHCVEANIYPQTICIPTDLIWDGSITTVDANCDTDSVTFTIKNTGSNNMSGPQDYIVIEDNIIMKTGQFQLAPGQELPVTVPSNGSTYRIYADQAPGHFPSDHQPTVAIEGCGVNPVTQEFSLGFVNRFPEDDQLDYVSIDCQESIGSYDPNDKRAEPKGYGEKHYINVGEDLEYHIRFQNTGTDTAFTVVVMDTLSPHLDIQSIIQGTSSHSNVLSIIDDNILKFTFKDILLVDSATNEPGSHGFIKFKISQKPFLPLETVINNSAAIYFDFNAPIITNETYHTIGEDFIPVEIIRYPGSNTPSNLQVTVQPNPFTLYTDFVLTNGQEGEQTFQLFDTMGRLIHAETFSEEGVYRLWRNNLSQGVFFYTIKKDNLVIDTGKVVVQ